MKKVFTIILIINLFIVSLTFADSDKMLNETNNHTYKRIDQSLNWNEAKKYCESVGGYLANVTTKEENDFIFYSLLNNDNKLYWLGGTDEKVEGSWEWITGEDWTYTNWNTGEPNNLRDEDSLHFYGNKNAWNDMRMHINANFICEWSTGVTISSCVQMNESPVTDATAMLMQSGEIFQKVPIDENGCYIFYNVDEDKDFTIVIRRKAN